jgi:glycosyltransferase involved in cell wall biosynthesis
VFLFAFDNMTLVQDNGMIEAVEQTSSKAKIRSNVRGRIAIIVPGLGAGGTEHVVTTIANHWAKSGFGITIVTLEPKATRPYYSLDPSVEVKNLNVPPQVRSPIASTLLVAKRLLTIRRQLIAIRPDIVVSFLTRVNIITLLATRGLRIPVIVSERNNPQLQHFGLTWRKLRQALYPVAFGLVTMTQGAMDFFPKAQRKRSWVIPNFVNLPKDLAKRKEGRNIVAVGRLVPQKGFDLLIEAFSRIAAANTDWNLIIWGEGPDREKLTARRDALGLGERIQLPGISKSPGAWLQTADVFVMSSRFEGWGIVLLEAMAHGLPCVSYACNFGPSDMITDGQNGLLVPPENVEALATAMAQVLHDGELRQRLGDSAAQTAKKFSHAEVMAAWDNVIVDAVKHFSEKAAP